MPDTRRTTYTEQAIEELVRTFYARVRRDGKLGPVFDDRIEDWETHLRRMMLFWRSVLRGEAGYRADRGSPRALHARLETVTHDHYHRWLELFEEAASEVFEPVAAQSLVGRAERMAVHLSAHLGP